MFSNKINKFLKSADLHGTPIHLTYNGKTIHQSAMGGVLTILSRIGILAYFFVLVNNIVNRDKTIQTSHIAKSPTSDFQNYSIDLTNFDLAFTLSFLDNQPHTEERVNYQRYFNILLYYEETIYINNSDGSLTRKTIPSPYLQFGNCSLERFSNLGNEMKIRGLDQVGWFCPQNIKLDLKGQATSQNQNRIKFQVLQCANNTANNNGCATPDQINTISKQVQIQVATLNSFFDENKFDQEPIKRSINVEVYPLAYGFTSNYVRTMKKSVITTKDSWISPQFSNKQYTFYQESYLFNKFGLNPTQLFTISWTCDGQEQFLTRKVLSLTDACATAGGFAGIILLFAKLIAKLYCNQLFEKSIFNDLYKVEIPSNEKLALLLKFKKGNGDSKHEVLEQVMRLRTNLNINTIKYQVMHYLCFKRVKKNENYKKYQIAKNRLLGELDIVNILDSIGRLKIMEKFLLRDYQLKAFRYSADHELREEQPSQGQKAHQPKEQTEVFQKIIHNYKKSINRKLIKEILGIDNAQSKLLGKWKWKFNGKKAVIHDKAHDNLDIFEVSHQHDDHYEHEEDNNDNSNRVLMNDSHQQLRRLKRVVNGSSSKDEDKTPSQKRKVPNQKR